MGYREIKRKLNLCLEALESPKFSKGSLKEIQNELCNITQITKELNQYVKSIDNRVKILEQ